MGVKIRLTPAARAILNTNEGAAPPVSGRFACPDCRWRGEMSFQVVGEELVVSWGCAHLRKRFGENLRGELVYEVWGGRKRVGLRRRISGLRGALVGIVIGLMLGSVVSATAGPKLSTAFLQFYSGSEIMAEERTYRLGYATGLADMFAAVTTLIEVFGGDEAIYRVLQADPCMARATSKNLGTFTSWAETSWVAHPNTSAALSVLVACLPDIELPDSTETGWHLGVPLSGGTVR